MRDRDQLLRAYANGELTAAERARLRAEAGAHPDLGSEVAAWDRTHALFDTERRLREQAFAPPEPADEADEGYRRLQAVAARSEDDLRARLRHPVPTVDAVRRPSRILRLRSVLLVAAAALVALGVWWFGRSAPDLLSERPENQTLQGVQRIVVLTPSLSAESRAVDWFRVPGATGYDALVVGTDGELVLQRPAEQRKSTVWELSEDDFGILQSRTGELFLRVLARDGSDVSIGSSGDLPLAVR